MNIETVSPKRGVGRPKNVPAALPEVASPPLAPVTMPPGLPAPLRTRKPFGSQSQKLARPDRPGFKRRWINDTPGRISRAREAGWEHVLTERGENDIAPVGVAETGGALMAYLMETPEAFYNEDQAAEQARVTEMEKAYSRGADKQGEPGVDGRYIPSRGISIRSQ